MTIEIKVPPLGESVSEASIAKLHKKVGDAVKADELILELETDKVTLEVNAPANGVISDLKVKEGDNVKVGDLVAVMQEGASAQATPVASSQSAPNLQASVASNKISAQHELSPAPRNYAPSKFFVNGSCWE